MDCNCNHEHQPPGNIVPPRAATPNRANQVLNTLLAPHILLPTDRRGMRAPSAATGATTAAETHSRQAVHINLARRRHAAKSSVRHRGGFPFARKFPLLFRADRRADTHRMAGGSSATAWRSRRRYARDEDPVPIEGREPYISRKMLNAAARVPLAFRRLDVY